jgi:peptide/nickel transport system permease protein
MLRFVAARLLRAALTIALVVTFAFVVLRLSGDPAQIIMGADAPPEAVEAFRAAWGLDEPLWVQYLSYFWAILQGDLGRSMRDGRDAIVLVAERIPATLALTLPFLVLAIDPAFAQNLDPLESMLQVVVDGLTGPIGRLIAILAVVASGYMMFTGRLIWPLFLAIFFGVVLVFSAATIIDGFAAP